MTDTGDDEAPVTGRFAHPSSQPMLGPPTFVVPCGESFECPCGSLKVGAVESTYKWTSFETQCLGCGAVVVMDGG